MSNIEDTDRVNKVEHVWCDKDDRWVYLEYNEIGKIVGMNFMQGDEYESFKKSWSFSDSYTPSLSKKWPSYLSEELCGSCLEWAEFDEDE